LALTRLSDEYHRLARWPLAGGHDGADFALSPNQPAWKTGTPASKKGLAKLAAECPVVAGRIVNLLRRRRAVMKFTDHKSVVGRVRATVQRLVPKFRNQRPALGINSVGFFAIRQDPIEAARRMQIDSPVLSCREPGRARTGWRLHDAGGAVRRSRWRVECAPPRREPKPWHRACAPAEMDRQGSGFSSGWTPGGSG